MVDKPHYRVKSFTFETDTLELLDRDVLQFLEEAHKEGYTLYHFDAPIDNVIICICELDASQQHTDTTHIAGFG